MNRNFLIFLMVVNFLACSPEDKEKQTAKKSYFDLEAYFAKEQLRLTVKNPVINKTVSINDSSESELIKITDWKKELAAFRDADINKTAWRTLFKFRKEGNQEFYSSNDDKIPVKALKISYKANRIFSVEILIKNANTLYESTDTLRYFPDSLYQVIKNQNIKLFSKKRYQITGRFKI